MKRKVIRVTGSPSPIAWFHPMIGQVSEVYEVYEPTGFMRVRLMQPIAEYDWCMEKPIERHWQVEGWIDPRFVEEVL